MWQWQYSTKCEHGDFIRREYAWSKSEKKNIIIKDIQILGIEQPSEPTN